MNIRKRLFGGARFARSGGEHHCATLTARARREALFVRLSCVAAGRAYPSAVLVLVGLIKADQSVLFPGLK
jgi:hypothetical protein